MSLQSARVRNVIFFLFLLGFFVSAPLVVLHTIGYRFDGWKRVNATGVITLVSHPKGAAITVDDRPLSLTTPATITSLTPGKHLVEVQRPGYRTWKSTVEVAGTRTTPLNLTLLRDPLVPREVWSHAFTREPLVSTDPTHRWTLVMGENDGFNELSLLNEADESFLISRTTACKAPTPSSVIWHASGLFAYVERCGESFFVDIAERTERTFPEALAGHTFLSFDPLSPIVLFASATQERTAYHLVDESLSPLPSTTALAIRTPNSRNSWVLLEEAADGFVLGTFDADEATTHIMERLGPAPVSIADVRNNTVLLGHQKGGGVCRVLELTPIPQLGATYTNDTNAPCVFAANDSTRLLTTRNGEVVLFEKEGRRILTRLTPPIRLLGWLPESELAVVEQNQQVIAIETESGVEALQFPLLSLRDGITNPELILSRRSGALTWWTWQPTESAGTLTIHRQELTAPSRRFPNLPGT